MIAVAILACVLWATGAASASADTLGLAQYRDRLMQTRALMQRVNAAPAGRDRDTLIAQVQSLLRRTSGVFVDGGTIDIDDSAIADRVGRVQGSLVITDIDRLIAFTDVAQAARRPTPEVSDARLREVLPSGPREGQREAPWTDIFGVIVDAIVRFFTRLFGNAGLDLADGWQAIVAVALLLLGAIVFIFGRGLPERFRRDTVLASSISTASADARDHLRLADAALAAGDRRTALHELYRYAVASLMTREAVRYDPALTDRELLSRAQGVAHIDELRELVAMHERVWFGLHMAADADAGRARDLAVAVAG